MTYLLPKYEIPFLAAFATVPLHTVPSEIIDLVEGRRKEMKNIIFFTPCIGVADGIAPHDVTAQEIIEAPCLFSADRAHAQIASARSSLVRRLMDALEGNPAFQATEAATENTHRWYIDSWSTDPRKGTFTSRPGYHSDGVRKGQHAKGQPDITQLGKNGDSLQFLISVSVPAEITSTRFVVNRVALPVSVIDPTQVWTTIHHHLAPAIAEGRVQTVTFTDGKIAIYDSNTLHTAQPVLDDGHRYILRASRNPRIERPRNLTLPRSHFPLYKEWPGVAGGELTSKKIV